MRQMTERSAKWMESVKTNFAKATGKPVEAWVKRAKSRGFDKDIKESRRWLKEKEGLTMVQANYVLMALFPESEDERLAGEKATARLVANPKSTGSDPTHTIALGSAHEVNREVVRWLKLAYEKAAR